MVVYKGSQSSSFENEQRRLASLALDITEQEWELLGLPDDQCPNVAASSSLQDTAERVTALILVRLIALTSPSHKFSDLSTTTICPRIIHSQYLSSIWPQDISEIVLIELRNYVTTILHGYNAVPYHNFQHAYHVIISSNKLLDLVLKSKPAEAEKSCSQDHLAFEQDPLLHLSLPFAALIHDVAHLGVPNAQLINENHPLALQYNDQSIAEQRSIYIGFNELLKADYENLRSVMFPFTFAGDGYRRFRQAVTNLVLATDIASPDRGDIVKKRWREAFECSKVETKPRVIPDSTRKGMLKGRSSSFIAPPKEHPLLSRVRQELFDTINERQSVEEGLDSGKEPKESWIELGLSPSTHFPKACQNMEKTTQVSMQDSLAFWWFTPEEICNGKESSESDSFSDDADTGFFSTVAESASCTLNENESESKHELNSSINLLNVSEDNLIDTLDNSYSYPNEPNDFQISCSSVDSDNSVEFQHLLSPTKCNRHGKWNRSSSSMLSWKKNNNSAGNYSDLSAIEKYDSSETATPKGLLKSFPRSPPKNRRKKIIQEENSSSIVIPEVDPADLTSTDVSSTCTGSVSSSRPDASPKLDNRGVHAQKTESSNINDAKKKDSQQAKNEHLCSMSLLEHILLVSDVAHTMQNWDVMNKFAYRLSKEIQKSIDNNRSGGITTDPLSDWYTNQSGFLRGYIKPLAERIERTGYIPVSADRQLPLLSTIVQTNLDRWQEEGHDVVSCWRRKRDHHRKQKRHPKDLNVKDQRSDVSVSTIIKNRNFDRKLSQSSRRKQEHVDNSNRSDETADGKLAKPLSHGPQRQNSKSSLKRIQNTRSENLVRAN